MSASFSFVLAALGLFAAAAASAGDRLPAGRGILGDRSLIEPAATLTLPDGTTMVLPPGVGGVDPLDHLSPRMPPRTAVPPAAEPPATPEPEAAVPKAAEPKGTPAEQRKQRIDALFVRLAGAADPVEAESISSMIERLSLQTDSATADLLMSRALSAMAAKNETTATALLDKIIALRPDWAEAWNKRATVRYLQDDDAGSMEDISHVLTLEPRHVGALSGMGFILHRNGNDKAALTVLRRAHAIDPQQPEINTLIDKLTPDVEGHDL